MKTEILCDGQCPECIQKGVISIFQESKTSGYWECPSCSLQLQMLNPNHLGIMNTRGDNDLKTIKYDKDKWGSRVLLRMPYFKGDDCIIENEFELNQYLQTII